ncbi:MAG: ATP-dependent zinc metalloprotease FtsH [Gammaproteobacteria bacterium]
MKQIIFRVLIWMAVAGVLFAMFNGMARKEGFQNVYPYSDFIETVRNGLVEEVSINENSIDVRKTTGETFVTYDPGDPHLVDDLLQYRVKIKAAPPEKPSLMMEIFFSWFPFILLIAVWIYFMRRQQGGMGGSMSFGKSRAKLLEEDKIKVRFDDVAGVEEAKEDVVEMVDFLKDPSKFEHLGGKIPRGVLMVGPPGTGKTLLARAVAGEAGVPFFSISGSDFVEMYVGVGASRVRDMFAQAKEKAPCIIFIDEIDAVGRQRGAGLGGGHDEREQTLNQLLVEMDGFTGNEGIIVIAATNRPDVLDKALLRPGRFDRQVTVGLPDIRGREQILAVHLKKVPQADDVDVVDLARGTPGFSGADLANLVNEAALFAARNRKKTVTMNDLDKARDKIIMGAEKRSLVMSEEEKRMTAYHEAGHAIVGRIVPGHDPVYKVSIMPRGRALGITMFLPERDQYSASKQKLESQIASLYGGRVAEQMIYGDDKVTTGASNDIERATDLARNMVTRWGLSERMGPLAYGEEQGEVFLGRSVTQNKSVSGKIAHMIDEEIRSIIDRNYERAQRILAENIQILHNMADALMEWETIDKYQIDVLMKGRRLPPPEHHPNPRSGTKPGAQGGRPGKPQLGPGGLAT